VDWLQFVSEPPALEFTEVSGEEAGSNK